MADDSEWFIEQLRRQFTDHHLEDNGVVLEFYLDAKNVRGAAVGIQESTLRAVVADLVAPPRRATAYGVYAAVIGVATAAGGALTGLLYAHSVSLLVAVVIAIQVGAIATLPWVLTRRTRPGGGR